jgi:hypothetical protein
VSHRQACHSNAITHSSQSPGLPPAREQAHLHGIGSNPEFNDAPGVPGQNDPNPPGWFSYDYFYGQLIADHVIDVYNNMIYDPSYGQKPFASAGAWANNALAGFAYITYTDHRDAAGNLYRTYTLYGHKGLR